MKGWGLVFLVISLGLLLLNFKTLSGWSLGLGSAMALSLFAFLSSSKEPELPASLQEPWKDRYHELERESSKAIHDLKQEIDKSQQKLVRAEERCQSYQKLIDVHQGEIEKLKTDHLHLGEMVIQKEKKINELKMAHLQPDLFQMDQRNLEAAYHDLKKQWEEQSELLNHANSRVVQLEEELAVFQKGDQVNSVDLIEQLKQSEEERKRLEAELVSLQHLVSELAQPEEELF